MILGHHKCVLAVTGISNPLCGSASTNEVFSKAVWLQATKLYADPPETSFLQFAVGVQPKQLRTSLGHLWSLIDQEVGIMFSSEQNYIYADCSWFASKTKEGLIGLGKSEKKRNRPLLKTCFKRQRLGGLAFLLANLYLPSWKHLNRRFELSASLSLSLRT